MKDVGGQINVLLQAIGIRWSLLHVLESSRGWDEGRSSRKSRTRCSSVDLAESNRRLYTFRSFLRG